MSWHEPSQTWRSGDWSLQLRDDEFAEVRFDSGRVLRSIRAVVRDRDWNTPVLVVDGADLADDAVTLAVHTRGYGAQLSGTVRVAAAGSRLTASLDLVSASEYWTNRVGLVVLHAPQAAGCPLRVVHADGSSEATAFPSAIRAHQPVFDIAELSWTDDGIATDVRFAGEVFEMEDQRNWSDASFKTYSRPLALPFPYRLAAGQSVHQSVRVQAARAGERVGEWIGERGTQPTHRTVGKPPVPADTTIVLVPAGAVPDLALGASTAPSSPEDPAPEPDPVGTAVLVELDLADATWPAALERAAVAGLPLDIRFVLDAEKDAAAPDPALARAVEALLPHRVARISAFQPSGDPRHVSDAAAIALLRDAMASAGLTAPVVGGARSHFTELNRERHRLPGDLDGVVFSLTPLFHSLRTEQLVESLAVQRLIAVQAVGYAGGSPVHIGPVTLRPHFNDVATTPPPRPGTRDLSQGYGPELLGFTDARQDAHELAAWTVASAAALAVPGVSTLTYFEEWGPRGIRTASGHDRPVAAAVRRLAALSGTTLLNGDSPDGLVWALGSAANGSTTVLVANLDRCERTVTVRTPAGAATATVPAGGWVELPSIGVRRRGA